MAWRRFLVSIPRPRSRPAFAKGSARPVTGRFVSRGTPTPRHPDTAAPRHRGTRKPRRQDRGRGAVRCSSREHATRAWSGLAVSSAPHAPSPAQPATSPLQAMAVTPSATFKRLAACADAPCRRCGRALVLRSQQVHPQGRGRGVGRGWTREARRRCVACAGLRRVFVCQALHGSTASAVPLRSWAAWVRRERPDRERPGAGPVEAPPPVGPALPSQQG